jgi:hypothetical protein
MLRLCITLPKDQKRSNAATIEAGVSPRKQESWVDTITFQKAHIKAI